MAGERIERILALLAAGGGPSELCSVSAEALALSGAGIMLMPGGTSAGTTICSSDAVSSLIEDLQHTYGEGPCVDAFEQARPILEPDLAHPEVSRWMSFTPPAVEAGARAVFGFPLRVSEVRIGALNLYRDAPGPLSREQHADALVMADVVAREVLARQADAFPGLLPDQLEEGAALRFVVHQASGMVSVQLGVSLAEALDVLRAHAFDRGEPLTQVADDVVARRLRMT